MDPRWPDIKQTGTLTYDPEQWVSTFQLDDDWEICETNYHWSWNPLPDLFALWSFLTGWAR